MFAQARSSDRYAAPRGPISNTLRRLQNGRLLSRFLTKHDADVLAAIFAREAGMTCHRTLSGHAMRRSVAEARPAASLRRFCFRSARHRQIPLAAEVWAKLLESADYVVEATGEPAQLFALIGSQRGWANCTDHVRFRRQSSERNAPNPLMCREVEKTEN